MYALNERTSQIVGQRLSGLTYELVIAAQNGDNMLLWYEIGGDRSPTAAFTIGRMTR